MSDWRGSDKSLDPRRRTSPTTGLESVARTGALDRVPIPRRGERRNAKLVTLSLRVSLVVRVLRRQTYGLGCPSCRHCHVALGKTDTGPITVTPVQVQHPVPFSDGYPTVEDRYNTATEFLIDADFQDGTQLTIRHDGDNGILFEGSDGRLFVNRGRLSGAPVEELASKPLPEGAIPNVYKGRPRVDHCRNFFESVSDRTEPISDVFSHHRALSTCHLAGIAARLGRTIKWDPVRQAVIDDRQAQGFLGREKRPGFEINT